jgi:lipopolysaccharide biosynthesis glycosyltransferase
MLTIFCGYDKREAAGFHIFCNSVLRHSSIPVAFVPVSNNGLKQGTNTFTLSRFLVPYLMKFKGKAIFADASDMICLGDVAELQEIMKEQTEAIRVVKHAYQTKHKVKYVGTEMESTNVPYDRKNWASLMLIDCEHPAWRSMTPKAIATWKMLDLLQFQFLTREEIGEIPNEWNRLVDEDQPVEGAKILHWTAGIPGFKHYANAPGADLWRQEWAKASYPLHTQS